MTILIPSDMAEEAVQIVMGLSELATTPPPAKVIVIEEAFIGQINDLASRIERYRAFNEVMNREGA